MESPDQYEHWHGKSTTQDDEPPDDEGNDADVHDDATALAHGPSAYDTDSAGPANGNPGDAGTV